jgi:glucosamine--fructose-6-phosphate aminotransferase (isomerizing)
MLILVMMVIFETLAAKLKDFESMYVIGRGLNYPMALEAAINYREVSYIMLKVCAGGGTKHGPIALIAQGTPLIGTGLQRRI